MDPIKASQRPRQSTECLKFISQILMQHMGDPMLCVQVPGGVDRVVSTCDHGAEDIWDNPSHWLVFLRGVETTNQLLSNPDIIYHADLSWRHVHSWRDLIIYHDA
jgi:hypothetical protein